MADIPHLALPLRLVPGGNLAVLEQDSLDDVSQCVAVLLATTAGSRIEVPEYGVPDPAFSMRIDTTAMQVAVEEWEPRAAVDLDDIVYGVQGDDARAQILAAVRLAGESDGED